MKIQLITLLLLFSTILSISAQKKKKDIVSNKIKSITEINEDFEKNNGRSVKESFTAYDEYGNIVELIEYDDNGKEKKHIKYEYDDKDNCTKETYLNPKGQLEKTVVFKYDDGIKIEKTTYLPNGKIKVRKKYVYQFQ